MEPLEGQNLYEYENGEDIPQKTKPRSIFIFDDLAESKHGPVRQYFSFGRHYGTDCFYLGQTYSRIPKGHVRDNANLIVLFKQDTKNLRHVYDNHVSPEPTWEKFQEIAANCWKEPFGFLTIDKTVPNLRKGFDEIIHISQEPMETDQSVTDQPTTMEVTNDIVKARDSIRKKYDLINIGKIAGERAFAETFDPIIKPLKEISAATKQQQQQKAPEEEEEEEEASEETVKKFVTDYMDLIMKTPDKTDQIYGIRTDRNLGFKIGSEPVQIRGNDLVIGPKKYEGTEGLYELLVKRQPKKIYSNTDLDNFKKILEQTSAHKSNYSRKGSLAWNTTYKYRYIVSKLFQTGSGLFKTHHPNAGVDYKYYRDPNELVNRLRLLLASRQSGSSAHLNEIAEIGTELNGLKLLTKEQFLRLLQNAGHQ